MPSVPLILYSQLSAGTVAAPGFPAAQLLLSAAIMLRPTRSFPDQLAVIGVVTALPSLLAALLSLLAALHLLLSAIFPLVVALLAVAILVMELSQLSDTVPPLLADVPFRSSCLRYSSLSCPNPIITELHLTPHSCHITVSGRHLTMKSCSCYLTALGRSPSTHGPHLVSPPDPTFELSWPPSNLRPSSRYHSWSESHHS